MEALAAVSLISSIVQFLDFSSKIVNAAVKIRRSTSGTNIHNRTLESVTSELGDLSLKLVPQSTGQATDDEKALGRLAIDCRVLSDQIRTLLQKIKPKSPNSRKDSIWSAIKTVWSDREMKELMQRLQNCRSQLELHLVYLMRSDTKAKLEALAQDGQTGLAQLEQLQGDIDKLCQGVTVTSMSHQVYDQLLVLLQTVSSTTKQERILKALAFGDMYGRFENVESAHFETFEWIFAEAYNDNEEDNGSSVTSFNDGGESIPREIDSDPASTLTDTSRLDDEDLSNGKVLEAGKSIESHEGGPTKFSTGESFLHWLSAGDGIFHISGKLGSGKSTLMKFLCEHDATQIALKKWGGQRQLIFAKFFFWKPGSKLQRSLNGLFRCLLHDVLQACPELIPKVLPDHWNKVSMSSVQVGTDTYLRGNEIRNAFTRLINDGTLYGNHCFCFFVDGLDEYEESHQEDYKAMVDLLLEWTNSAPSDVKICVSSREYNVFMNSFSPTKRLRLQDLTRGDMQRYIEDKLGHLDSNTASDLVSTILDKASGIFLWVVLVVKQLRERIEETQNLFVLKEEIETLPDELEDLFQHLLKSLSKTSRATAYKTFAMLQAFETWPGYLSTFAFSFLEDYIQDSMFAMKIPFKHIGMDINDQIQRTERAEKTINGNTRGLLEATDGSISYVHRSIPDFLKRRDVQDEMNDYLQRYKAVEAVSQLLIAELRAELYISGILNRYRCGACILQIMRMRRESGADHDPFPFLDSLDDVVNDLGGTDLLTNFNDETAFGFIRFMSISNRNEMTVPFIVYRQSPSDAFRWLELVMPVYIAAVLDSEEYVAYKIRHDRSVLDTHFKRVMLLSLIETNIVKPDLGSQSPFTVQIFKSIFDRGLSPNAIIHPNDDYFSNMTVVKAQSGWERFLLSVISCMDEYGRLRCRKIVGEVLATFLKYGADPLVKFFISYDAASEGWKMVMTIGKSGRQLRGKSFETVDWLHFLANKPDISFRELVQIWDLENKKSLLELIDENIKLQEQVARKKGMVTEIRETKDTTDGTAESLLSRPMLMGGCTKQFYFRLRNLNRGHVLAFGLGLFIAALSSLWITHYNVAFVPVVEDER